MWTPDIRTLFLILFLVNAFLTLMLFTYWKTQKTYYGFATWMQSLLVISIGYLLLMLRDTIPTFISVIVANFLVMLSVMMRLRVPGDISGKNRFLFSSTGSSPLSPACISTSPMSSICLSSAHSS